MAVSSGWYIFLGIAVIVLFGFLIWLVSEFFKDKKKLIDRTIGINFCSHLSAGRFIGSLLIPCRRKTGTSLGIDIGQFAR